MRRLPLVCAGAGLFALAAGLFGWHEWPHKAHVQAAAPVCTGPAELAAIHHPLPRLAERVAQRAPITIVAVGSSSTAGSGASSPAASYPARLEAMLRARWGNVTSVTVLNRGVGGEEVRNMLARFDRDVIAAKPDLVLWQVGTNSVLHDHAIGGNAAMLADGLNRLKATGTDVVLINPQFAPKVLAKPAVATMLRLISTDANAASVELFDRFAVMKYWRDTANIPFEAFLSPDLLHMNDWGYDCLARLLADAIVDGATHASVTAGLPVGARR
jgi:lysophospholipase L1-like esterase